MTSVSDSDLATLRERLEALAGENRRLAEDLVAAEADRERLEDEDAAGLRDELAAVRDAIEAERWEGAARLRAAAQEAEHALRSAEERWRARVDAVEAETEDLRAGAAEAEALRAESVAQLRRQRDLEKRLARAEEQLAGQTRKLEELRKSQAYRWGTAITRARHPRQNG